MKTSLPTRLGLSALALAGLLAAGCAGPSVQPTPDVADAGIRIESLRLTAAGSLLDLRFRITDAQNAAPFFNRKTELLLVDTATGATFAVPNTPKLGRLKQTAQPGQVERSYFVLFANPGRTLKSGSRVELMAGDRRMGQVTIE